MDNDNIADNVNADEDSGMPVMRLSYAPLVPFFNIEGLPSNSESNKLEAIWDYVNKVAKSASNNEKLHTLRKLESKLASPQLGETRIGRLYYYIKAQQVVEDAEKWRNTLIRK